MDIDGQHPQLFTGIEYWINSYSLNIINSMINDE